MSDYTVADSKAALRLLENADMGALMRMRLAELQTDMLLSSEKDDILSAHAEHQHLSAFGEWLQHVSEHNKSH